MATLKYMPIFRLRRQEKQVLLSRSFGDSVYPCVEIIKALEQKPREPKKDKAKKNTSKEKRKETKKFEDVYLPILARIKADKVFVDLPVHMKQPRNIKPEVLNFLRNVVDDRLERTKHILKFAPFANRIIPVISTYFQKTNEANSIILQERDLRKAFNIIAFRTFPLTFIQDYKQIAEIIKPGDYFIFDLEDALADKEDPDVLRPVLDELKKNKKCHVVIVRNIVSNEIKNSQIDHGKIVKEISNDLLGNYKLLHGTGFGDYAGIKKDGVTNGAGISPGFIFYDPVESSYYGYKGNTYEEEGKTVRKVKDFESIIIPHVLNSESVRRMKASKLPYLNDENQGWKIINSIKDGLESGQSQAKFKRISMEHYVHCIMTEINAGQHN